jgi:hypothetical protein
MSIVLVGSSSGSITLQEPAVAGTTVLDLPATSGTVVVSGTTPTLNGITFPATQVPSADANTLDDYEEGTWTPNFSFDAATGITYTTRFGRYTKIGRQVYIFGRIVLSSKGSSTGSAFITNLPFASELAAVTGNFNVSNAGASLGATFSLIFDGTSLYLYNQGTTERVNLNHNNFTNTTDYSFSVVYGI